ncbi:Oidioi.mRNA.OKI2018_I69.PAR.g13144.t1.cds [Oikopleura dioica]|uniref:Oidioi.mRNA.OKI2018_I69.PAR.g13144.t1.cds n=1 Tax=Oikopleura dioica TaxID=34765 RepID=A0ABN7S8M7_OIKDI|nr:Oidioi.mRNA.OKI2018_I69.PAR.g13144.t1.cds [Oikopleura dioica]
MAAARYNSRSPAVKRLLREAAELHEPTYNYYAQPLEENLFEWHFTIRGPEDTVFENGIYHGRIVLPPEYPMKPPNVIFMTPNGRFELHKKICLSISGYHPETWRPSWSIRTALLAMIGFMPTHGNGAIGSLDYTDQERSVLTKRSVDFKCKTCGATKDLLLDKSDDQGEEQEEIKKYSSQLTTSKPSGNDSSEQATDKNDNETAASPDEESSEALPVATPEETNPLADGKIEENAEEDVEVVEEDVVEISRPRRENDFASFFLMWFLILAISFIIYRRLNKSYGIDLVQLADQYLTSLMP